MHAPQVVRDLKSDVFGRIELLEGPRGLVIRRVACGSRVPLSHWVAGILLRRERRALEALRGIDCLPQLLDANAYAEYLAAPSSASIPVAKDVLLRSWIPGVPLYLAEELPRDFFERLEDVVHELHLRGVCHNDLHKEPNVLVTEDGQAGVIDFQLASVHERRGRRFSVRASEDRRHVLKHRRRYERALEAGGRPPSEEELRRERGLRNRRSVLARVWMRFFKPAYNFVTRRLLAYEDGEARRPSRGPWPVWTPASGPSSARQPAKLARSSSPDSESTDSG